MLIRVECESDERGEMVPRRIVFDQRVVEARAVLDRWYGKDYRYFKIRGDDGIYLIRHMEKDGQWDLVMFRREAGAAGS